MIPPNFTSAWLARVDAEQEMNHLIKGLSATNETPITLIQGLYDLNLSISHAEYLEQVLRFQHVEKVLPETGQLIMRKHGELISEILLGKLP